MTKEQGNILPGEGQTVTVTRLEYLLMRIRAKFADNNDNVFIASRVGGDKGQIDESTLLFSPLDIIEDE